MAGMSRSGHDGHDHGSHAHGHGHAHGAHTHTPRRGHEWREERKKDRRRLILAALVTGVIALAEAVGGWLTNYLALLSDAAHMLTDVSALVLSLLALWFSSRPADAKRTYGFYRLEILSALANGVVLIGITIVILLHAWERFRNPTAVLLGPAAIVSAIGLVANLAALGFLHNSHSINVRSAFLHVLGDTLSSCGVLVGIAIMALTGWWIVDPILSVLISLVIVWSAIRLVREAVDVLLEAVPRHVDMLAVREVLGEAEGVREVHDLHVWTITSGIYALSAHLVVADPMVCNNDEILSAVKHKLLERFGIDHTTIQIESETFHHLGEVH